jgi:uncharacterized membrane protein
VDYQLPPADVQAQQKSQITSAASILLILLFVAGATFAFYRYKIRKGTGYIKEKESKDQEIIPETTTTPETETIPVKKNIRITGEMQKVIETLSEKEKSIILLLLRNGGSATQADIRYKVEIPKSSLTGIINALNRKNIIKKREYGRTNIIELSEWFLSENKVQ